MNYKKYEMGPYNLHIIKNDKFKTNAIEIKIKIITKNKEALYIQLLSDLLIKSTNKYKNSRQLEIASEELYNAVYSLSSKVSGKYKILDLSISFLNEKYADENIVEDVFKFIHEILFNPDVHNNAFDENRLNQVKATLKDDLKFNLDIPSFLGKKKLNNIMNPEILDICDMIDDIDDISGEELYNYYLELLKRGIVDIFVCGDVDENKIKENVTKYIEINTIKRKGVSHYIKQDKFRKRSRSTIIEKDVSQSSLNIGYKLNTMTNFETQYTSYVYNYILGSGMNSLLFKDVREKHSLCYTINSTFARLYNIMYVTAGIDSKNYKKTLSLVKKNIKKISEGKFDEKAIEEAKEFFKAGNLSILDSQFGIIGRFVSIEYLDQDSFDKRGKEIDKVTKEDVMKLAKKIHLDTIVLVKGSDTSE